MLTSPTDLSTDEEELAGARRQELAESFTTAGSLRTPVWKQVFTRTWRHPYVPAFYPELRSPEMVSAAEPQQRARWLSAVYSDQTLITRIIRVPAQNGTPGAYRYASSSSLPSLVVGMLEDLEVTDGMRVLEIGTGTGYNAALLCERLGSDRVTSVDIDPQLVALARERLAANGYTPTLAAVDGAQGYPAGAPYDRIIATCSVPAIPPAWLNQTTPGGMIMVDVRGLVDGTVARLTVGDDGTATGRFQPHYRQFMSLRADADMFAPMRPRSVLSADAADSVSTLDPTLLLRDARVRFVAQWPLAGLVNWGSAYGYDEDVATQLETSDGSIARIWHTPREDGYLVTQIGPRRLWDHVEHAVALWNSEGRPGYDHFGITATPTEQYVWYDHPDSPHRWPLPPPPPPGESPGPRLPRVQRD